MNTDQIDNLITEDMLEVNTILQMRLKSKISLINRLVYYIFSGGGKRIRSKLVLLIAKALSYRGKKHIIIASIVDLIHTATLLHDDVIDQSDFRRGKPTTNKSFGNVTAILLGDFIYTRAFQMITELDSNRILNIMSKTVNIIAEGEILQFTNCNNLYMSISNYMEIIYRKTARLFESASKFSAIITGCNKKQEIALQNFGKYLGIAFQLMDDLLDYSESKEFSREVLGNDLKEGKITFPLLHAIRNSSSEGKLIIRKIIKDRKRQNYLGMIVEIMKKHNSLEYTRSRAEREIKKAINCLRFLSPSPYKEALKKLARAAVKRRF